MNYLEIEKVIGREILDSRGNPTVEAEVTLVDGTIGRGMAPSDPGSIHCQRESSSNLPGYSPVSFPGRYLR